MRGVSRLAGGGRRLLTLAGVNRAVGYTLAVRGLDLAVKPITLYLSLRYLSVEELGYFYTFAGVLGLQVFFELGIGAVVQQFFSHEAERVAPGPDGRLHGDPDGKARVGSLFHKSVIWHAAVAVAVAALGLTLAPWLFDVPDNGVNWRPAWTLTVLATVATISLTPIVSTVVGLGDVTELARIGARSLVVITVTNWTLLVLGWGLLAGATAAAAGVAVGAGWTAFNRRGLVADIWRHRAAGPGVSWRREIWPFQWRIALSWLSGYFIFQLFTPITFAYYGARAAGMVGFTSMLFTHAQSVGAVWLNVRLPRFGVLIARRDYQQLDAEWRHASVASVAAVGAAAGAAVVLVWGLHEAGHRFADRLLPVWLVAVLAVNCVLLQVVTCLAVYLRGHRQEPLLLSSVVSAAAIGGGSFMLGRHVGYEAMLVGYVVYNLLVGLPWVAAVFVTHRHRWRVGA